MVGSEHSLKNFSSPALTVWDYQCLEDPELKDHLISNGGDYRTAPATPGLLVIYNDPSPTCLGIHVA